MPELGPRPDMEVEDIETPEDADEVLTQVAEAIEEPAGDLAVAVERLRDAAVEGEDGNLELPDDLTLPFYEENRELTFAIGIIVGATLEAKERATEATDEELSEGEAIEELGGGASMEKQQSVSVST